MRRWGEAPTVEGALALLYGPGGFGFALGPAVRVTYPMLPGFLGRIGWTSTATRPELAGRAGSATLDQQLLLVDMARALWIPDGPLTPLVSLGLGAYHLRAQGKGNPPYIGHTEHAWAAAAVLGAGVTARRGERVAALLGADAVLLLPAPNVLLAGEPAGSAGFPVVRASLGLAFSAEPAAAFP
jgi:hypothetical protein